MHPLLVSAALLIGLTSAHPAPSPISSNSSSSPKYIVNFGDSYSQTGYNLSSAPPSASNPLGNPAFPGWTTSNGNRQNWLGTLITAHNRTLALALNLASGGATTDAALVAPYAPYPAVLSLVDQVDSFAAALSPPPHWAPWTPGDTLVGVWMGVNDVGNGWYRSGWRDLVGRVLDRYFEQVGRLYEAGARKFVFLGVPPIYLTPAIAAQGADTVAAVKAAVADYNGALRGKVEEFGAAREGVTAWVFDTAAAFEGPVAEPGKFGARDASCYQESGTECLWFNDYHPGQAIHDEVAKGIAELVGNW